MNIEKLTRMHAGLDYNIVLCVQHYTYNMCIQQLVYLVYRVSIKETWPVLYPVTSETFVCRNCIAVKVTEKNVSVKGQALFLVKVKGQGQFLI